MPFNSITLYFIELKHVPGICLEVIKHPTWMYLVLDYKPVSKPITLHRYICVFMLKTERICFCFFYENIVPSVSMQDELSVSMQGI